MDIREFEQTHFASAGFVTGTVEDNDAAQTKLATSVGVSLTGTGWDVIVAEWDTGTVRSIENVPDREAAYAKALEITERYLV